MLAGADSLSMTEKIEAEEGVEFRWGRRLILMENGEAGVSRINRPAPKTTVGLACTKGFLYKNFQIHDTDAKISYLGAFFEKS